MCYILQVGKPGAAAYNHMAMAAQLRDGTGRLLAAWQASEMGEGKADQHIRLAHGTLGVSGGGGGEKHRPGGSAISWGAPFLAPREHRGPGWGGAS